MELFLLRHGIAEDAGPGQPDSERRLTEEGRSKLKSVLQVASQAGVKPDLIISSPYRRAMQTAEIAADQLGYRHEIVRSESLIPDSHPEAVWDEVRVHKDASQILLAGHEPLFSSATAYLLNTPELRLDFKKGGIVRITLQSFGAKPHGILQWILTPKLAR